MFVSRKEKWLIIFTENSINNDLINHFIGLISRIENDLNIKSNKDVTYHTLISDFQNRLYDFCKTLPGEGEARDLIDEFLYNEVVKINKPKHDHVAIVFSVRQTANINAYKDIINDPYFDDKNFFSICYRSDFYLLNPKAAHVEKRCENCMQINDCNQHSCLPRLIWLFFNRDERVRNKLIQYSKE